MISCFSDHDVSSFILHIDRLAFPEMLLRASDGTLDYF